MSLMQREKGKRFERKVAALLRRRYPDAVVRRASQAERAHNPDVFVENGPEWLDSLWLELHDAREPNPRAKLAQAERDVAASTRTPKGAVVVWHRLAERTIWATMRFSTLENLLGYFAATGARGCIVVTVAFDELLDALAGDG